MESGREKSIGKPALLGAGAMDSIQAKGAAHEAGFFPRPAIGPSRSGGSIQGLRSQPFMLAGIVSYIQLLSKRDG